MKTIWISLNRSNSALKGGQTCHRWAVIFWKESSYWEESISINTGVKIFTKPYDKQTCCHPDFAVLFIEHRQGQSVSLVAQSCPTLCDPMNLSTPGLPDHHQLLEFTQTHVWVSDAIQPSHPLSSPSPPALNLSQHQGLFQWISSSHQVAKVLEFQHQSFQWIFRKSLYRQGRCSIIFKDPRIFKTINEHQLQL